MGGEGGRDREADSPADSGPSTPDAIEIAMDAERHDAAPDSPARRVLLKHERLIEAQTSQLGRQRWRDFIITALGVCVLASGALLVWDASRARGVVIEAFAVPPDMAERGLTGLVLATQMLDRLTTMQSQTESLRAASTYANDWRGDIAVEIPNTGVSIGELRRYLREWLGDQTRLSGEVFRLTDGRIAVTTRVGASPPTRAEGAEAELDALLQQGAEAIYAETQPYRYAVWLNREGRREDNIAALKALTRSPDINDRLWAYNGLGANTLDEAEKQRLYDAALRLKPDFSPAIYNRAIGLSGWGRDEAAFRAYEQLLENTRAVRRDLDPDRVANVLNLGDISIAAYKGDMGRAGALSESGINLPTTAANTAMAPLTSAYFYLQARDIPAARRVLSENGLATPEAMAERLQQVGPDFEVASPTAWAMDDFAAERDLLIPLLAAVADYERDPRQSDPSALIRGSLAVAMARTGQIVEARATIASTALDCAPCVRQRGLVEAYAGNPRGADHWLSESVRITPSLPTAHAAWAEAYLVRRDPVRAAGQARLAVEKGPNWADPRKLWGDALMMQNKPREAVRKYRDAVRLAPNWGGLHLALARAQAAAGQAEAARESFRRAARLDLNPTDRAAVQAGLAQVRARSALA